MATWDFTVNGASNQGGGASGNNNITDPAEFDGATINSVTVLSSPTVTADSNPTTDDGCRISFWVETSTGTDIYGSDGVGAAICSATFPQSATSSVTITDDGSSSPAPTTGVGADWDRVAWALTYNANMKDDSELFSWSSFTIRVDYTEAVGEDNLLADNVESASELTSPAIGQVHIFGAAGNLESASELTSPALGQVHIIGAADNVESASELTSPVILEVNPLLADNVESASELTSPAITQVHAFGAAGNLESASELTAPVLAEVGGANPTSPIIPYYYTLLAGHS